MNESSDTRIFSLDRPSEPGTDRQSWPAAEALFEAPGYETADLETTDFERGFESGFETTDATGESYAEAPLDETWAVAEDLLDEGEVERLWTPRSPGGTAVNAGRLVVERVGLLRAHKGTPPDLVLKWNSFAAGESTPVDIVLHLHGYSGKGNRMSVTRDKEPVSGLDFADPANPSAPGRTTPTLAVLPRGSFFGGKSGAGYAFPQLTPRGAVDTLVAEALRLFAAETGVAVTRGRLILTAHSGGGAAVMAILGHTDPDEVHTFDALYSNPAPLVAWATRHARSGSGALRVLFRKGEPTAKNSLLVARAIAAAPASDAFRVESTSVAHNDIPRTYGWRLLADPGANLANTAPASAPVSREQESSGYFGEDPAGAHFPGEDYQGEGYSGGDYSGETADGEQEAGGVEIGEWNLAGAEQELADVGEYEIFPSTLVLTPTTGATGENDDDWDPNSTGLPLFDTGPDVRSQKIAANFTVGELVRSGDQYADRARISLALVIALQKLREHVGRPVRITSGYRSWARNVAIYTRSGARPTKSRHCSGQAADIKIAGLSGLQIAKAAVDALGDSIGVGIGPDFAHLDVRGTWTVWTYLGGDASTAALREIESHRSARKSRPAGPVAPTASGSDRAAGRVRRGSFSKCADGAQPGAVAMAKQWTRLTGRKAGIFNCRKTAAGTPSLHGEGRSIDLYARESDPVQKAQAEAYIAWLLANAVELQVAYVIWNRRQWGWQKRLEGWRKYTLDPHTDHIHVDLSWEGAKNPSALFSTDPAL